jgi:hypothetical protein
VRSGAAGTGAGTGSFDSAAAVVVAAAAADIAGPDNSTAVGIGDTGPWRSPWLRALGETTVLFDMVAGTGWISKTALALATRVSGR